MNQAKRVGKRHLTQRHRFDWYEHSLDLLLAGKCPPEYVKERWDKVKQVR